MITSSNFIYVLLIDHSIYYIRINKNQIEGVVIMDIKLIRNATLVVQYAGKKFLIDPFLADKGTLPPFPSLRQNNSNNPLVSLPISIEDIIHNVDAVIVTHLHYDHWDDAAKEALPKEIKIFI